MIRILLRLAALPLRPLQVLRNTEYRKAPLWGAIRFPNHFTTLELRQPLIVVAFVMVLAWYVAAPGEVAVMSLVTLGGLLVSAFLWARTMALHVAGARQLRYAAVQVGDELEELVTLDNASALPVLWAEFVDRSDLPGYTVASVRAADAHNSIHWRARALCARHGLYTLGPWELRLGDPFGIFLVRQFVPWFDWNLWWPIGLIALGAMLLVVALRPGRSPD